MRVLVLAEHNHQNLYPSTAHVLHAASLIGDEIILLVAGHECQSVADEGSKYQGVTQVRCADAPCYAHPLAENLSLLINSQLTNIDVLMAPATTFGKDVLPRVAAMHEVVQISDITKIIDENTFERPIYAGNAIETVAVLDKLKVLTVRATAFEAVQLKQSPCPIEKLHEVYEPKLTRFVKLESSKSNRPELSTAKRVVSGGRGLQSKEQFKLVEDLADALDAAVGASRAAVDAGFISNDHQVGQTGKVVAPELYVALGISGAVQHLAGIKDAKIIVAINKDEEAPIFQVADYALVGDLFHVVPEMIAKLKG